MTSYDFAISGQHYLFDVQSFAHTILAAGGDAFSYALLDRTTQGVIDDVASGAAELGVIMQTSETESALNEALAEAALRAGCRFFFGYPITPQTELAAYMAKRMPKVGGTYLQAESEIAAINMVYGAASAGARAMTSSSSPGVSLKGEGVSYMSGSDLPGVIINVQRGGPGLGGIQPSQSDYWQATRAMGHGDHRLVVFAPATVQEMADLIFDAFDVADRYRQAVGDRRP